MSFKMAARIGFRAAMAQASPTVLEPISRIEVVVPADYQGDIMGDLSSRRGQLQGTVLTGSGRQRITALVPTSEILRYAIDLRSITQGWGTFTSAHDHLRRASVPPVGQAHRLQLGRLNRRSPHSRGSRQSGLRAATPSCSETHGTGQFSGSISGAKASPTGLSFRKRSPHNARGCTSRRCAPLRHRRSVAGRSCPRV